MIGEIDRLAGLGNGVGGGHADGNTLFDRNGGAGAQILPDLRHRLQHEGPRGAQIDLGLARPDWVTHCRAADCACERHLVARGIDKAVERAPRNAQATPAKPIWKQLPALMR